MKKLMMYLVCVAALTGCLLENGKVVDETTDAGVDASESKCTVTIRATDGIANENGDTAMVQFERSNCSLDKQLEVKFDLSGTASSSDYVGLAEWYALIPAGQTEATIVVVPFNDTIDESDETLIFTIRPEPHLIVGAPAAATVTITDDDSPPPTPFLNFSCSPNGITAGGSSTCTWTSNATACTLSGGQFGSGVAQAGNGSVVVSNITTTTTFGMTCNNGQTKSSTVTVNTQQQCTGNGTLTANTLFIVVGSPIDLDATFNCPSGTIARVEFKVGSTTLCTDTSAAYHCDWDNATVGTHTVIATAYSSSGTQLLQTNTLQIEVAQTSQQVSCHGLGLYFSNTQVNNITRCTKWSATGSGTDIAKSTFVDGGLGACALTCYDLTGNTVLPLAVTGVWLQNGTSDVTRWYTSGCARLPWHPAAEPDQAGGAWDRLCDRSVASLSGPPNTNQ